MGIIAFIDLAGSVALLLWGVHMVQTGVQRACGAHLNQFLAHALRNRGQAFLTGLGITALLQSSTATGLMITGFAARGAVQLVPALAVMLGANVGTTLIVQVLSFDVSSIAPLFVLLGVILFRKGSNSIRDSGRAFIGLGLILISLHQFLELLKPYTNNPHLHQMLETFSALPLMELVIGAIITWAMHSSVAMVLLVTSFATHGVISPQEAFVMVLGANIGTSVNPVIEGGAVSPEARRLPVGNLLNRCAGALLVLVFINPIATWFLQLVPNTSRAIADFHTLFNMVLAAIMLPILPLYARFLAWLLPKPQREKVEDPSAPRYLNPSVLSEAPSIAVGNAVREALRLCDNLDTMILSVRKALEEKEPQLAGAARRVENTLDKLNTAIRNYVTSIDTDGMNEEEMFRVEQILSFCTQINNAGNVLDRNVIPAIQKMAKQRIAFPPEMLKPLMTMVRQMYKNLQVSSTLLMSEDEAVARNLVEQKNIFRNIEASSTASYYRKLRAGDKTTQTVGPYLLELLRDLKRVNTHIIAAAAYPVLERQGALLPSKLQPDYTTATPEDEASQADDLTQEETESLKLQDFEENLSKDDFPKDTMTEDDLAEEGTSYATATPLKGPHHQENAEPALFTALDTPKNPPTRLQTPPKP
ncbi:Na/Pi cotransporter family protein [Entomobacter blattae]|uniref:Na+/Pi-cotransporter n=1 Tax=Entomobacter blattae TaxID=2762277 RepID=A0A7H1NQY9_9PROT|nr:Na/Pi cotransporter family protein [Entomobacter blattae]QNT78199.1 Na+/Pi-cotransporter [Entomobacter blattae]